MDLTIPEMSCGHCKAAIEKAVISHDPGAILAFDLAGRHLSVQSTLPLAEVQALLLKAGYASEPLGE